MWEYLITLIAMILGSAFLRNGRTLFVLLAISANWLVNTLVVGVSGATDPWWAFLPADYMTALVLLICCDRPCRWVMSVSVVYAAQCIAHGYYGAIAHDAYAMYYYYYFLSYSAWAQLLIVGGWLVAEFLTPFDWHWRSLSSLSFGFSRKRRDGEGEES